MEPLQGWHASDQERVNAQDLARRIEPAAVASWPARETMAVDGWLLRFTDGCSHRANSVATHSFSGQDLEEAVDRAEAAYRARHLIPRFQITPLTPPAGLEDALLARGYADVSPTHVMTAPAERVCAAHAATARVSFVDRDDAALQRLILSGSRSDADGRERIFLLSRIALPLACVLTFEDGVAAGCGVCVLGNGLGGIYLMRTDPARRRRGHARNVLSALACWARDGGADELYLQVDHANGPARALYAGAGFANAYSYRYCRAPEAPA